MARAFRKDTKVERRYNVRIFDNSKNGRKYPPGQHGLLGYRGKSSNYAKQLAVKQSLRYHYSIKEKQFKAIFLEASRTRGDTGKNFIGFLESRLDMFVYRSRFAPSIHAAQQLVSHKHITVNGVVVNIISYRLKINDVVKIRESMRSNSIVAAALADKERSIPEYIDSDIDKMESRLVAHQDLTVAPIPFLVDINAIIAFYSR